MSGHKPERLVEILGVRDSEVDHWVTILGNKVPVDGLTDHQAASIGAVVRLQQTTPQTKKNLERFFVRLALMTDPESSWIVQRMPRKKEPEIVFDGLVDATDRDSMPATVLFEKDAFIELLNT